MGVKRGQSSELYEGPSSRRNRWAELSSKWIIPETHQNTHHVHKEVSKSQIETRNTKEQ
jgi:hypothetical protein